ncbi:hypothetical protein Scep_001891 [Stephania cephalantha]|uniref:Uncharacterized protein n=1 Tax=Stephania cephalantha TaxID=152367 RepID=A0AAP0L9Y9_9MAGN
MLTRSLPDSLDYLEGFGDGLGWMALVSEGRLNEPRNKVEQDRKMTEIMEAIRVQGAPVALSQMPPLLQLQVVPYMQPPFARASLRVIPEAGNEEDNVAQSVVGVDENPVAPTLLPIAP